MASCLAPNGLPCDEAVAVCGAEDEKKAPDHSNHCEDSPQPTSHTACIRDVVCILRW